MALQHVTINGHDVAYRTSGAGPMLLLVHGTADVLRDLMNALGPGGDPSQD
jgi:hypothetical protein